MSTQLPAVEAIGVQKVQRVDDESLVILDDINLVVPAGQFLAVCGPSGSGKTTLVNCISGLDTVTAGTVQVNGMNLAKLGDRQRSELRARTMGFVFQAFNLIPVLTAEENVALSLRLSGLSRPAALDAARGQLDRIGLSHRRTHLPSRLSGGEQQRVAIARAMASKPRILWADEPTGNLDTTSAQVILGLFKEIHEQGVTVVLITHEPTLAVAAERRVLLRDGRIVADDNDDLAR